MTNPRAKLPITVFDETFSTGILNAARWQVTDTTSPSTVDNNLQILSAASVDLSAGMLALRLSQLATTHAGSWDAATNAPDLTTAAPAAGAYYIVSVGGSTALSGIGGWVAGQVAIYDGVRWHKVSAAPAYISIGSQVISKKRFGYGTYEFVVRASSAAPEPTLPGNAYSGSLSRLGVYFDAGNAGLINIFVENEGLWQRVNNWRLHTGEVVKSEGPDTSFNELQLIWLPDKIELRVNGKLSATITDNLPSITGQLQLTHLGTNNFNYGGALAPLERTLYVSHFRYTPSSNNLARNSSFEQVQAKRPYSWYQFFIGLAGDTAEPEFQWFDAPGRIGGRAAALRAITPVPYVIGDSPRRWGIRTAPWEDPDHPYPSKEEDRTGIREQWRQGDWYVCSLYAKKVAGASWSTIDLAWSSPPNQIEPIENPPLTTDWQRYAFRFLWTNPVEPNGNLFINVVGNTAAGDELHVDDIRVALGREITPFVREAEDVNIPLTETPVAPVPEKLLGTYFTAWDTSVSLRQVPLDYNTIFLFHAEPNGISTNNKTGHFNYPYHSNTPDYEVQAVRARGQRVILTVGGARAHYFFLTRAASNNFLTSIRGIISTLGGIDGIDFNNFEQFSAPTGYYPRNANGTDNAAWATMAAEMSYIASSLKVEYGTDFQISTPVAPGSTYAPGDRVIVRRLFDDGVLDMVQPQYYDSPDLVVPQTIKALTDEWVALLNGDATKVGIALGANYAPTWAQQPVGSSIAQVRETIRLVRAAHPTMKGVVGWSTVTDARAGYSFVSAVSAELA